MLIAAVNWKEINKGILLCNASRGGGKESTLICYTIVLLIWRAIVQSIMTGGRGSQKW